MSATSRVQDTDILTNVHEDGKGNRQCQRAYDKDIVGAASPHQPKARDAPDNHKNASNASEGSRSCDGLGTTAIGILCSRCLRHGAARTDVVNSSVTKCNANRSLGVNATQSNANVALE